MTSLLPSRRSFLRGAAASLAGAALGPIARAQPAPAVSCALVLAADVSSSIDGEHWWLQRKGYAEAFLNPEVIRAITETPKRQIAVSYFEWSGYRNQHVIVPWTVVASEEDGAAIADLLLEGRRPFEGPTAIGAALECSMLQLTACPFTADHKVIDVSGDGGNNDGPPPEETRDQAARASVRVNGLPIDWARSHPPSGISIGDYYRGSVIGGPSAFAVPAVGFDTFAFALAAKLRSEVA
ncbi:MAG: DUF1194 domain-containing protein [Alphaproteobacteria bacterium]|nr:DUF1194 domain-containing protein [Alphaproteobacteria bacterium]